MQYFPQLAFSNNFKRVANTINKKLFRLGKRHQKYLFVKNIPVNHSEGIKRYYDEDQMEVRWKHNALKKN